MESRQPISCSLRTHARVLAAAPGGTSPASTLTTTQARASWSDFKATLADLRRRCPAALPVVVRMARLTDTILGECVRRRKRFVVRLNDRMAEPQAIDVLLHEWAHALAWNFAVDRLINAPDTDPVEFERACHDEAWGCAYSRVWRAYLDVIRVAA